jgi:hypothetical protein
VTTTEEMIVHERYEGPPQIANGGVVCGMLAESITGPAEVRIAKPVPVGIPLEVERTDGGARLLRGGEVLAAARPRTRPLEVRAPIDVAAAEAAISSRPAVADHPFPYCFVCGPHRGPDDGLQLLPGRVDGSDVMACLWRPATRFAEGGGTLPAPLLWGALDCPSYWPVIEPGRVALLGTLSAHIEGEVRAEHSYVVMSWARAVTGRRLLSGSAIYSSLGELIAAAEATWISVDWDVVARATGVSMRPASEL